MPKVRPFLVCVLYLNCILLTIASAQADDYPRRKNVDVLHYAFTLTLHDDTDEIQGIASIRVKFSGDNVNTCEFDLIGGTSDPAEAESGVGMVVDAVHDSNNRPVAYTFSGNRIRIDLSANEPEAGDIRIFEINYHGIPEDGLVISKNRHGKRTFFSDHFPNRARQYLPSIDHPYDKATSSFTVIAPQNYEVISNGVSLGTRPVGNGMVQTEWKNDVPLPTYLMAIGVADFAVREDQPFKKIPISAWVYEEDAEVGLEDFNITPSVLQFLTENVGPYPFAKLANVESNTRWGGMENASCIFYPERSVASTTPFDGTVVHEISHQWFGDSVTESDWDHVWLSEGFATYFTHLYNEKTYGRDRMNAGLKRDRKRIFQFERRRPGIAIVDTNVPVDQILSTLTYEKGSWVLHMLRGEMGDENFWRGIRAYYTKYRNGNALTDDLRVVMEELSGKDLKPFFDRWVYSPGHPVFDLDWSYDESRKVVSFYVRQVQAAGGRAYRFPLDVVAIDGDGNRVLVETLAVSKVNQSFEFKAGERPTEIEWDPNTRLLFERANTESGK